MIEHVSSGEYGVTQIAIMILTKTRISINLSEAFVLFVCEASPSWLIADFNSARVL